ncbi:hypothetical protein HDZ31DRAFT_39322 [Schizophyllum fasciatum]
MAPIILYDIPSKVGCWTPNTWKIRYALNYKGLPFRTEWVEYPDIEGKCKEIGAEPTSTRDGKPLYTCPVIQDTSTGKVVSDGPKIAKYLDEAYPDAPKLFPEGSEEKQNAAVAVAVKDGPRRLVVPCVVNILNEASKPFFRATREKMLGGKLEELILHGDERTAALDGMRGALEAYVAKLDESGKDTPFLLGDKPCFADLVVAGFLQWFKAALGEDSDLWKGVSSWGGGRLRKYLEDLQPYEGDPTA